MECELLRSPMISYRSLLYNTTVLYDKIEGAIIHKLYHEIASQTTASLILTENHVAILSVRHKLIITECLYAGQSRVLC